ncbi:MAG TPA: beta-ketoacyl synthase N-terminal-like domain-containing protein [Chthoniobacterales bacterium]
MSLYLAGMGWITPLGSGVAEVWERLLRGEEALAEDVVDPSGRPPYRAFRVPAAALKDLPVHARLRRASAISRFAAAAGTAALRDAREKGVEIDVARMALVFAISNGGVSYTRRFYHDIVASGAGAASPLLFPETVFNAPASHLAALLGITGATYTLVGDGAVGLSALNMAEELMTDEALDYCLVVGAEETDWLLSDAYTKWRLLRSQPPIEPFACSPHGTILSEGAGAVVVARRGFVRITATHPGGSYKNRRQLGDVAETILREIGASSADRVVTNANGTFVDAAEAFAISRAAPKAHVYTAAPALGEGVGASGLWQTIIAAHGLVTRSVPPLLHAPAGGSFHPANPAAGEWPHRQTVVMGCGLNQQVAAVSLALS